MYIGCMLTADDRTFFERVSRATFANPFGETRETLDRSIAAGAGSRGALDLSRTHATVSARLADVAARSAGGRLDLSTLPSDERTLLEHAVLFDLFHRHVDRIDAFILEQRAAGDRSLRVPFARDVVPTLVDAGFPLAEAHRYLALFFQLRRAFYFIERSLPGTSGSMRRFREHLWNNLFTFDARLYARSLWRRMEDFSTFLLGETGTGKGTAAAAIGRSAFIPYDEKAQSFAASFEKGFVSINLSQFPEALLESELFGHKRGAFTGAVEGHTGLFSRCSAHGAIFLDEIGEASPPVQIKLLRVLQERTFSPVGGHDLLRFSGRVVAATNRTLGELRAGSLRDDFYYRLCSDVIVVPPLRQRVAEEPGELAELCRVILERILGEGSEELSPLVLGVIDRELGADYTWPGNVRELEQCVRRVILTGHYEGDRTREPPSGDADGELLELVGDETAQGLTARYCAALHARHGSYEEVARRTGLDRRTVKAHVLRRAARP